MRTLLYQEQFLHPLSKDNALIRTPFSPREQFQKQGHLSNKDTLLHTTSALITRGYPLYHTCPACDSEPGTRPNPPSKFIHFNTNCTAFSTSTSSSLPCNTQTQRGHKATFPLFLLIWGLEKKTIAEVLRYESLCPEVLCPTHVYSFSQLR